MKILLLVLTIVGSVLVSGQPILRTVEAQPYGYPSGYGSPGYRPPAYPRGYRKSREQSPSEQTEGSVEIINPKQDTVVSGMQSLELEYNVEPGPKGDHIHVYLDGREVGILRQLRGRYTLGRLRPGSHEVAIKVVNRGHVPIGIEQTVKISVS